jgi:hypothetical protein
MSTQKFITDKKAFTTALFEEAFGKTVNEVLSHWDHYTSLFLGGALTNMLAAYKYAQQDKDELEFYSFMCFWLACHDRNTLTPKSEYYKEALEYCKDSELKKDIELNYNLVKERLEKETHIGIHPSAANRIVGIEKLKPFFSGGCCLHDAEVKSMVYDRDKNILDIDIDTCIPEWSDDNKCHIIPFRFSDLLSVEVDMDYGNDYVHESHIYADDNFIYAMFDSVYLKICSRHLSIGDVI